MTEAALAPAREHLEDEMYTKLCAALALVFGTESMVVLQDTGGRLVGVKYSPGR